MCVCACVSVSVFSGSTWRGCACAVRVWSHVSLSLLGGAEGVSGPGSESQATGGPEGEGKVGKGEPLRVSGQRGLSAFNIFWSWLGFAVRMSTNTGAL